MILCLSNLHCTTLFIYPFATISLIYDIFQTTYYYNFLGLELSNFYISHSNNCVPHYPKEYTWNLVTLTDYKLHEHQSKGDLFFLNKVGSLYWLHLHILETRQCSTS